MLMTILEVIGRQVFPALLRKSVRDEVSWNTGAAPWRRCPFWLVLRVAVQRHFCLVSGGGLGRLKYKLLMSYLLVHLLDDCAPQIHLELSSHLKSKICRRLVKLENEKDTVAIPLAIEYEQLLSRSRPALSRSIDSTTKGIHATWEAAKKAMQRPILLLPQRVNHPYLQLLCSRGYLKEVLERPQFQTQTRSNYVQSLPQAYRHAGLSAKPATAFANHYFSLADEEIGIEQELIEAPTLFVASDCKRKCLDLSKDIDNYLSRVGASYQKNPEQTSAMLLTVMDLWMAMDLNATKAFGILKDYNTGFPASIMDVLQIARRKDMYRLQKIRAYIQKREAACKYPKLTIFSNVQKDCFAERYYDNSTDNDALLELHELIEEDAERLRQEKKQELHTKSMEYEEIARELMVAPVCFLSIPGIRSGVPYFLLQGCTHGCEVQFKSHFC